jgi:O-antigen biosynthesis protein
VVSLLQFRRDDLECTAIQPRKAAHRLIAPEQKMKHFIARLFGIGVKKDPMVSVIVPTHFRPGMLKEAVASILAQSFKDFEIVVINDGGPDVADVLASLGQAGKIVYLRHEKPLDRSRARNTGLAAARGKYVAYLDDDDIFYPNHLKCLLSILKRTRLKVAYSDAMQAKQTQVKGRYEIVSRIPFPTLDFSAQQMLISNYIPNLCIMHEKSCLEVTGVFDPALSTHEDWDLWIRLSHAFEFAHLKQVTCEFRFRDDKTNTTSKHRADFLRTAELIYQRYEGLVNRDPKVIEGRKNFLKALRDELAAAEAK